MHHTDYPILEFDPTREAIIDPSRTTQPIDIPARCVLCFFQDVIAGLVEAGEALEITRLRSELGPHPVYGFAYRGQRLALLHPGVGAPLAAGFLEEAIALGCRRFIVCGGAGALAPLEVGEVIVPHSAVRDEGTSYHYAPPGREIGPSPEAVTAIEAALRRRSVPYRLAKTWTTDAFYRETPAKVRRRREEGCLTVEMEAAALFAVASHRGVTLGQMLYAGDDVSGVEWDPRDWHNRGSVRESLLWLAAEACLEL